MDDNMYFGGKNYEYPAFVLYFSANVVELKFGLSGYLFVLFKFNGMLVAENPRITKKGKGFNFRGNYLGTVYTFFAFIKSFQLK